MNIYVIGARGYIGRILLENAKKVCAARGTSSVGSDSLLRLQLEADNEFNYNIVKPLDVVFITAAISSPDICAHEHSRAWGVNVTGTSAFIEKVMDQGGLIVFFSSDTIYGERDDAFDESVTSSPVGEYAVMKHEVENRFLDNPLFKTIRLSYVFSREDNFTKYLSSCAKKGEEADIFHPFYRAIVHRDDVVEGALSLAQNWDNFPQQIINFGGPEVLSRVEFADCLKQVALPSLRFRATKPEDSFFKNRPQIIAMHSPVLPKLLGRPLRSLTEAAKIEFPSGAV